MATLYELDVDHQGTSCGDFCIYQTYEDQDEDIRSLVWFSKKAHPGTKLKFRWGIDYSFAWCEEGSLEPGVVFHASEVRKADPSDTTQNSIAFKREGGAYHFVKSDHKTTQGKLGIRCDSSIPAGKASIGIAMSGNPAFARSADPNLQYTFGLHPKYWIAFGDFEEGEVIDLNRMTQRFEIDFPINQYQRSIRLTANNSWEAID